MCFLTFQPLCSAFLLFTCTKLNKLMLIIIWQTQISWTCFLKKLSQNKLSFQCSTWLASVLLSLLSLLLIGLFFDPEFIALFVFLIHKLQAYYHAVNIQYNLIAQGEYKSKAPNYYFLPKGRMVEYMLVTVFHRTKKKCGQS